LQVNFRSGVRVRTSVKHYADPEASTPNDGAEQFQTVRWHNQIEMFRDAGLIHYFQGGAANG
jgi:hypothetical protein